MCELMGYHTVKSMIGFSTILRISDELLAQSMHNFKVVFLVDLTTLCQEFMMHHVIAIEENSKQNLYI